MTWQFFLASLKVPSKSGSQENLKEENYSWLATTETRKKFFRLIQVGLAVLASVFLIVFACRLATKSPTAAVMLGLIYLIYDLLFFFTAFIQARSIYRIR
jgi:hypothetical protein